MTSAVQSAGRQQRRFSLAVSGVLHAGFFVLFMQAPRIELPRASESEYKQAIKGKEEKLVWYKFRKELPAVSPVRANPDHRPLQAQTRSKQVIVSSPKDAPKRDQMVWTPAPQLVAPPLIESPNLVAVKLPDQPFTAPPATPTPPPPAPLLAPDAPQIVTRAANAADLPASRLPPKDFKAPAVAQRLPAEVTPLAEAPQLAAASVGAASAPAVKLPPRPFTAPPGSDRPVAARGATVETNTPPLLEANSTNLNVAIVGLNPIDAAAPLPSASAPAAFSSGPKVNPNGATSEGTGKGLAVPDLFVRGPRDAKPDLIAQAYAAPTSKETLRAAMRVGEPGMTVRAAPESAPANTPLKVSGAPDPRFNGRDVFMMAIQMANLTSYSGSWLMWYADHTAREAGLAPIAAPVPHRKVDPKYVATAVEERVEGTVTLGCVIDEKGKVAAVELIRGIDDRLNESAKEALSKWEFYPAARRGIPVAVDVLVQIPFRLAPKIPKP